MKLSILMPVYNERYTVRSLLKAVCEAPLPKGFDREIIVVDDHSTDGTWEILQDLSPGIRGLRLLRQDRNCGKGAAIRWAIEEGTGDIAIFQDADLEYDPNDYVHLVEPILRGHADVVYGTRFSGGRVRRVLFFRHALGNRFLTFLSNVFTDLNLSDMETCYKVFRMELLKSIPLRSNRFGLEPEFTAKIAKRGFRIFEVPISYFGRTYQEGKKVTWKDGISAFFVILKYWMIDDIYVQSDARILHALSGTHRFNTWLAEEISPYVGNVVLEIGAGIGNMTVRLLPRDRYVCSDVEPLHLHGLKNLFFRRPNVEVRHLDISASVEGGSFQEEFDTIICLNVLEHIQEQKRALANMYRLLRPGGRMILLVPNAPGLFCSLDVAVGHVRRYTREEIGSLITEAGFEVERTWYFNRVSTPGWVWNGKILRRHIFPRFQLKVYDLMVWFWKRIDSRLPWPSQSIILVAGK